MEFITNIYSFLVSIGLFFVDNIIVIEAILLALLGIIIFLDKKNVKGKVVNKKTLIIIWSSVQIICLIFVGFAVSYAASGINWRNSSNCPSAYKCECEDENGKPKEKCDCIYENSKGKEEKIICPNNTIKVED